MEKEHLPNKVVREIIAMLAGGEYSSGDRLPAERELCRDLSVSRGTLRKALSHLGSLGVLDIRANSGVYVKGIAQAKLPETLLPPDFAKVNLDDVIQARKAIELAAIEAACSRITSKQCTELNDLLLKMQMNISSLADFLRLDMEFHQAIVRASGNVVLMTAFEAIYEYHKFSSVFTSQQEGEEEEALEFHRKILDKLEKGDANGCKKLVGSHLDAIKKYGKKSGKA